MATFAIASLLLYFVEEMLQSWEKTVHLWLVLFIVIANYTFLRRKCIVIENS